MKRYDSHNYGWNPANLFRLVAFVIAVFYIPAIAVFYVSPPTIKPCEVEHGSLSLAHLLSREHVRLKHVSMLPKPICRTLPKLYTSRLEQRTTLFKMYVHPDHQTFFGLHSFTLTCRKILYSGFNKLPTCLLLPRLTAQRMAEWVRRSKPPWFITSQAPETNL